jgi:hypothetical protein
LFEAEDGGVLSCALQKVVNQVSKIKFEVVPVSQPQHRKVIDRSTVNFTVPQQIEFASTQLFDHRVSTHTGSHLNNTQGPGSQTGEENK